MPLLCNFLIFCRDFTSDHTLRVEYGLANEQEQYESNVKVQQIMGNNNNNHTDKNSMSNNSGNHFNGSSAQERGNEIFLQSARSTKGNSVGGGLSI